MNKRVLAITLLTAALVTAIGYPVYKSVKVSRERQARAQEELRKCTAYASDPITVLSDVGLYAGGPNTEWAYNCFADDSMYKLKYGTDYKRWYHEEFYADNSALPYLYTIYDADASKVDTLNNRTTIIWQTDAPIIDLRAGFPDGCAIRLKLTANMVNVSTDPNQALWRISDVDYDVIGRVYNGELWPNGIYPAWATACQ